MAYSDFTIQKLKDDFSLVFDEADLFSHVAPIELRPDFAATLAEGVELALAVNTEKAKSEFIIAPLLLECRRLLNHEISLFSGIDLNVDVGKGLNGICDFILSKAQRQLMLSKPIITIVEAKNENIKSGIPQCVAAMYAAQIYNEREGEPMKHQYGAVTIGSSWRFMRIEDRSVVIDRKEYLIDSADKIVAIFLEIARAS